MKSVSQHLFALAPQADVPRSKFVQPSNYKTTFDAGYLIPFYCDEALPGDTFVAKFTAFARLSTPVVPFMDNLYLDFQFFAVPNRLLWEHWTRMMGERPDPDDSIDFLVPVINSGDSGVAVGSIFDYLGIPPNVPNLEFQSLIPRAYNRIWNEWYRDENLQARVPQLFNDGPDSLSSFNLLPRGKRKDYFTACLPAPQKGPGVSIPLGDTAPVVSNGDTIYLNRRHTNDVQPDVSLSWEEQRTDVGHPVAENWRDSWESKGVTFGSQTGLVADLSDAAAATINSLRQAFQLQRLLERDARGGTRYTELLQSHFGVTNPDARMQRSEYLGGGTLPMQIHSVAQTSSSDSTTPQGNLAAFGLSGGSVGFSKSFTEHCIVLGLVSVRADLTYQQGLHRMWSRRSRYDYYWPVLSNLGEQAVLNKEIYAQGGSVKDAYANVVDDKVFGYQERWAEYRYGVSKITGKLRSGVDGSLDVWHLAQHFANLPTLNSSFIQDKPPLSRVLAVQDEPQVIFDSNAMITKVRPMPMYSVPGLIDHF